MIRFIEILCYQPYERLARVLNGLRGLGYHTRLIYWVPFSDPAFEKLATVTMQVHPKVLKSVFPQLTGLPVWLFSYAWDEYVSEVVKQREIPWVYDYKDIHETINLKPQMEVERREVRCAITNSLAVTYRDGQLAAFVDNTGINLKTSQMVGLPEIAWEGIERLVTKRKEEAFERDGPSVVFIGNFEPELTNPEEAGAGQIWTINQFRRLGIPYSMYSPRSYPPGRDDLAEYKRLATSDKGVEIYERFEISRLRAALKQPRYSFGCVLWPVLHSRKFGGAIQWINQKPNGRPGFSTVGRPARYTEMLSCGLPLIVSEGMVDICEEVEANGLGFIIERDRIHELKAIIRSKQYSELLENVTHHCNKNLNASIQLKNLVERLFF